MSSRPQIRARRIRELTNWGRLNLDPNTPDPLEMLQLAAKHLFPRTWSKNHLKYAKVVMKTLQPEWRRDAARARYTLNLIGVEEPTVE